MAFQIQDTFEHLTLFLLASKLDYFFLLFSVDIEPTTIVVITISDIRTLCALNASMLSIARRMDSFT